MPEGRLYGKKRLGKPVLTPKELKFLKAFVKTGSQRLSALSAGYSPVNPDQSANCVMKQLRRKVPELLEHIGLHLEKVFRETLVPGLKAKKTEITSVSEADRLILTLNRQRAGYDDGVTTAY